MNDSPAEARIERETMCWSSSDVNVPVTVSKLDGYVTGRIRTESSFEG